MTTLDLTGRTALVTGGAQGLGVRELSVSPPAVPRVKAAVRELDVERCATLAREALTLAAADDVRKLVLTMLSGATR